jgi:hypothetical protein
LIRCALVTLVAALVLSGSLASAESSSHPRQLRFACAHGKIGVLQAIRTVSRCKAGERGVTFGRHKISACSFVGAAPRDPDFDQFSDGTKPATSSSPPRLRPAGTCNPTTYR